MKDEFDVLEDVGSLINVPVLTNLLDGKIWHYEKPGNSNKTDIVLNVISTTNQWMQQAAVNINVYVPVLYFNQDGIIQATANQAKFKLINDTIYPLVRAQYRNSFFTDIERFAMFRRDTDGSWYTNIKVRYRSIQSNFKNI